MNGWLDWGVPVIRWLQGLGPWLTPPMTFFSFLGQEEFYLLVMPAFFWCYDAFLGFRIGIVLLLSVTINFVFKFLFAWPRPTWVSTEVKAFGFDPYFGMPSGHAQNALVLWGRLASGIKKRWARIALGLLIFLISLSRLQLGVHFPMDVLGGWIIGGILLWASLRFEEPLRQRMSSWSRTTLVSFSFFATLLLILIGWIITRSVGSMPPEWVHAAAEASPGSEPIDPLNIKGLVSSAGALFGLTAGGIYLFTWGGFDAGGVASKRILRYFVGVIGVAAIFFGLRNIFPPENLPLRYLRYAAVGFWMSYLAPKIFVALKLAERRAHSK